MKIPAQPYRCALGRMQPVATNLDAIKQSGWLEQHILVVSEHDERLDFVEREFIRRIGERLYGSGGKHE
jgi:16S rRNA G966 N2-methylase RsmD